MKRFYNIILLAVLLIGGTAKAQDNYPVVVTIAPVPGLVSFPTDAMLYYTDPMSVFNIRLRNVSSQPVEVYLDIDLSCQLNSAYSFYHVYTDVNNTNVHEYIPIPANTEIVMTRERFMNNVSGRLRSDISREDVASMLQLPEGLYTMCITAQNKYSSISRDGSDDRQASMMTCYSFDVCYSGTAPEFMAPVLIDDGDIAPKLIPMRKTSFSWMGVQSNCMSSHSYTYQLKFVEVYPNPTAQYAVENNPVLATVNTGGRTFYLHDYYNDPYVSFDSGQVYAAQVEAIPTDPDPVNISNDGKSEALLFMWLGPSGGGVAGSSSQNSQSASKKKGRMGREETFKGKQNIRSYRERGNRAEAAKSIENAQIINPESDSDVGDSTGGFRIVWVPASGASLAGVDYEVSLYEAEEQVDEATGTVTTVPAGKPLKTVRKKQSDIKDGKLSAKGFDAVLVNGKEFVAEVVTKAAYTFNAEFRITEVRYINGYPDTRRYDSVALGPDTMHLVAHAPFKWVGHTASMPDAAARLLQFNDMTDTLALTCSFDPQGPAIVLSWNCRSDIGSNYSGVIYRSIDDGAFEPIASIGSTDRSYRDSKLPTGHYAVYYIVLQIGPDKVAFKSKRTSCNL